MDYELPDPQQSEADAERVSSRLKVLGETIAQKRDDAVTFRKQSGIEDVWLTCEENYLGIDEMNRADWSKHRWAKPMTADGPLTRESGNVDKTKSAVFIRLTARYVDAGHAKVCEILLPVDDKPFGFSPTPVPELVKARELMQQIMKGEQAPPPGPPVPQAPMPQAIDGAMPGQGMPGMPPPAAPQPTAFDLAKAAVDKATASAKAAETRIFDWMVEAGHAREMRKVLFDASRIGTGVLKGPIAEIRRGIAVTKAEQGVEVGIDEQVAPGERWVDPWNLYPDPSCGEDIHRGSYCLEKDRLTPRSLSDLKGEPHYLADQIDKVIAEGPDKSRLDETGNPASRSATQDKDERFTVWYFYGTVTREELMLANPSTVKAFDPERHRLSDMVFVTATLVNDSVIRIVLNPLESGRFPYKVFPWTRRSGSWTGVGVAEQVFTPQAIINAASRTMMTNAGRSAGAQLIVNQDLIRPADGNWIITPDKLWLNSPNAAIDDVRKAFLSVELPDRQALLMNIVEYAFRLAEESTNIPLVTQGQSGPTTPDTYGAAALQNNNANQLLRNIAATCDDCITEPLVTDYYEWLLLDPDVPDEEKGDFRINAHGSSALVERAIQDQVIQNLVQPSLNPAFGLNPKLVMTEYLKSKRIDPRSLAYTDEEQQKMAQQQPAPAPAVQAAQIRAEAQLKVKQIEAVVSDHKIKADTDRDTVFVQAQQARDENQHQSDMAELALKRELALLQYANTNKQTLETIKAELAQTTMKLSVQKDLATAAHMMDSHKHNNPAPPQVVTPAAEPAGRAPDGQAFAL